MTLLTLPRAQIPMVDANGQITREWYRWVSDATLRMGGVDGSSSDDLTLSQFEDAGIEEAKQGAYRLADELGQLPPFVALTIEHMQSEAAELRELVAVLTRRVQDLEEGMNL